MKFIEDHISYVEHNLVNLNLPAQPLNLYEPITYFLKLGGKRIRPVLTLLSAELFGVKKESAINLVGCSIPKVRNHLEKQFEAWMTWENYGRGGWHIDHIRPCMSFDLQEEAQQNVCFNWRNLRPMWAAENISKSDNYDPADEVDWGYMMRELGYDGELFLLFEEGSGGLAGS